MKKLFITFILSIIGFIGFSSAQFITNGDGTLCSSYCSVDGFDSMVLNRYGTVDLALDCAYNNDYTKGFWNGTVVTFDTLNNWCQSSGNGKVKGFRIKDVYNGAKLSNVEIVFKSSKIPFSALSPAIDSLRSSVFEIIPYIVFISIGLLLATIGYIVVRWFVNWLGKKIKSVFSSKRN